MECAILTKQNALHAVIVAFSAGTVLLSVPSALNAAYGYNPYPVYQVRQNVWRPTLQMPRAMPNFYRWRPVRQLARGARYVKPRDVRSDNRRWGRTARPLARGGDLARQFRPDRRFDEPETQGGVVPEQDSDLHAQFRPVRPRQRKTYEELYEPKPLPEQPAVPVMPYSAVPYLPPPLPMPYWPRW